ncbi:MAG TPA: HD domain-containing protein, partial [bacterium]|nr:HD domain-containing protein [bacterium]
IVHPLEVAEVVWRDFGVDDKNVILAALLHDSIEDQAELLRMKNGDPENIDKRRSGLDYIGKKFGSDVAGLVEELSNPEKSKKDIEKELISLGYKIEDQNFEREKNKLKNKYYLEHVKEIIEKDPRLMAIKLADFSLNALALDNVKDDPSRKAKLLVKYQPVGKLFLDKIDNPDETTKRMIEKFDSQKLSWLRDELEHLVG